MIQLRDVDIERKMGRLLQMGVVVAGSVMTAGGLVYLLRHGTEIPDYRNFHDVPPEFKSASGILRGLFGFRARSVIQLGVLLMIATPVIRVAFAIAAFATERDWMYTAISTVVIGLLAYALFWAG